MRLLAKEPRQGGTNLFQGPHADHQVDPEPLLNSVAHFERLIIREHQTERIARAKEGRCE